MKTGKSEKEAKAIAKAASLKCRCFRVSGGLGGRIGYFTIFVWGGLDFVVCRSEVKKTRDDAFRSLLETFSSRPNWMLFSGKIIPGRKDRRRNKTENGFVAVYENGMNDDFTDRPLSNFAEKPVWTTKPSPYMRKISFSAAGSVEGPPLKLEVYRAGA